MCVNKEKSYIKTCTIPPTPQAAATAATTAYEKIKPTVLTAWDNQCKG
jgi:hypothetical protein